MRTASLVALNGRFAATTAAKDRDAPARAVVAGPDGYRVEVYAHYWRHDVEKRRSAPLTR